MRKDSEGESVLMCGCLHTCMCTHAHACIRSGRKSKTCPLKKKKNLLSRNNCTNSAPVLREETRRGASADCSLHPAWDTAMLLQCTMADGHSLVPAPLPTFLYSMHFAGGHSPGPPRTSRIHPLLPHSSPSLSQGRGAAETPEMS